MKQETLNTWIYLLATDMIKSMDENLKDYKNSINNAASNEQQDLITRYNNRLVNQHNRIHEVLKQMTAPVPVKDENRDAYILVTPQELKSSTFTILANFLLFAVKYPESKEYAEKSFALFENQEALYCIAECKEKIKVQTKALSGAKKKQEAEEEKIEDVISTYLRVVKMDPYTYYGKEAGIRLINLYKHEFSYEEVF